MLVQAVLAAEDRTFYDHGGVDPVGIVRALWANLRSESVQQGGSTITQQYVKNVYLTQERTVTRKIKEAALAVKLERELPKQEILTRYLNTIYFGRGAYGVEAASRTYFGKSVGQTHPARGRLPGRADPLARDRRRAAPARRSQVRAPTGPPRVPAPNSVLQAMVETGDITQAQYDVAAGAGLGRRAPPDDQDQLRPGRRPESAPSTSSTTSATGSRPRRPTAAAGSPTPRSTAAACGSTRPSTSRTRARPSTR